MSSTTARVFAVVLVSGVVAACEKSSSTGIDYAYDAGSPLGPADGGEPTFEAGTDAAPIDAGSIDAANIDGSAPFLGGAAIDVPALGTGIDYHQGSYSLGWSFVANAPIRVTALGFYDDLKNGLTSSHPVAIFDKTSQTMLASTTVAPTDALDGFFRYAALDTPLTLTAGSTYVVMTWVGEENYVAFNAIDPGWTVNSAITYGEDAVNYAMPDATMIVYPDTFAAGGDLGPNFKFTNP